MSDFFMCIAQYVIILLVLVAIGGIGGICRSKAAQAQRCQGGEYIRNDKRVD